MKMSNPAPILTALALAAMSAVSTAAGPAASAAKPQTAKPDAARPDAARPDAARPNVNQITQAALQAGVVDCVPRINQVSNFVASGGERSGASLFLPETARDRMPVGAAYGVLTREGQPIYVGAVFAPNQANGCGAAYESVAYWEEACEAVAEKRFSGLRKAGELVKNLRILDGGPQLKVFLMPAGKGCVSIKKEMVS